MEVVKTNNLCKTYGTGNTKVEALKNANISVNKGEFVSIVGPSGSGKSTLLHLLGGVDRPTDGQVIVDGQDIYGMDEKNLAVFRRRKAGFIFQFYNLIPVLSAKENIELPVIMDGKKPDEDYFNELIDLLGIRDRLDHLPSELSGGERQRVSVGRALIYKPSIILADEPTGNLDSKNSREIIDLLKYSVNEFKQTLILITHDLDIAAETDRIITIEDGTIVSDGITDKEVNGL